MPTFKAPINTHPANFVSQDTLFAVKLSRLPLDSRILPLMPGNRSRWNKNSSRLPFSALLELSVVASSRSAKRLRWTLFKSVSTRWDTLPVCVDAALLRWLRSISGSIPSMRLTIPRLSSSDLKDPFSSRPQMASNSTLSSVLRVAR